MGKRSNFRRMKNDNYPTPYPAVPPLIPHLLSEKILTYVEPCCGAGQLVSYLSANGFHCTFARDLTDGNGYDALTCSSHCFMGADAIITNPPWSRHLLHPMIQRFSEIAPTWLLLDADWAHTKQAAPYLLHCSHIVSVGRLKWQPGSKHTGKDNNAWYRFHALHRDGPRFIGRAAV